MISGPIGPLHSARDVWEKMERDLQRMKATPINADPFVDFFIGAFHIFEWIDENPEKNKKCFAAANPLWAIARSIANGQKHCVLKDSSRQGVLKIARVGGYCGSAYWGEGYWGEGYWSSAGLLIQLSAEEAEKFGGPYLDAVEVAEELLRFWKERLPSE